MKIILPLLFISIFILSGCQSKEQEVDDKTDIVQVSPITYEIIETEDQSHKALGNRSLSDYTMQEITNLPIDKKIRYRVVVSPKIKENQVKPTIEKIISDITSKDGNIDEISLLIYSDKELTNGAYNVAMATWAPFGKLGNITPEIAQNNNRSNYKITIQVKKNLEEYLRKQGESEDKFGFSEEKRREIFKEFVVAEDRSMNEADAKYPLDKAGITMDDIKKNGDLNNELIEKYKAQVRLKYGITEDIESKITNEAIIEGWPME
ncbi:MAG: hypothetical protein ABIH48_01955 [Candidatus Falkowbacteria bacterium]